MAMRGVRPTKQERLGALIEQSRMSVGKNDYKRQNRVRRSREYNSLAEKLIGYSNKHF
jgi:hypothetical protein